MSSDQRPGGERLDWVDPERRQPDNAFDSGQGVGGLGYSRERERTEGERHPSGEVNRAAEAPGSNAAPGENIPPENGRRASFDPRTGEVRGSGSGAGGGNPSEDFDSDSTSGDGYPLTGSEGHRSEPRDPGPPRLTE